MMSLLPPLDTRHKRETLLAEEKRLAEALSDIRTSLNDLTAIAALPLEILEEIFGVCVSWLYKHRKPKYCLAWTQVCRTWRRVSFDSVRLWRCIDLCDSHLAHEFLIRSKTAPISIVSASPLKLCTDDLQPHADRLQEIDVFLFPDDMVSLFESIGPNLSNLTHMSLRIPPVSSNLTLDIDASSVTRLALDCVAIPWDTCGGLTYISLRGLPTEYAPSLPQLYSIFQSSPHLEYVKLECIAPFVADGLPPMDPILLPQLRELIISGKASLICCILSTLILPTNARLQLHCSALDDLHALIPAERRLRSLEISTIRLSRSAANFIRTGAGPWTDKHLHSPVSLSSSSSLSNTLLSGLDSLLDLTHITTLELSLAVLSVTQPTLLRKFLAQTERLECLRIAPQSNLEELFHILNPSFSTSSPNPICPRLATISFGRPGEVWGDFSDLWLQPLLALVSARHANSVALTSLEFTRCQFNQDTIGLFDGVASDVKILEQLDIAVPRRPLYR